MYSETRYRFFTVTIYVALLDLLWAVKLGDNALASVRLSVRPSVHPLPLSCLIEQSLYQSVNFVCMSVHVIVDAVDYLVLYCNVPDSPCLSKNKANQVLFCRCPGGSLETPPR